MRVEVEYLFVLLILPETSQLLFLRSTINLDVF